MGSPSSTTFERPDLEMAFFEFERDLMRLGFVAVQVAPVFEAGQQGANFSRITAESLLQNRDTLRASRSGYNRAEYEFEQDSYRTEEHGAEEVIDDRESAIYAYAFDYELVSSMRARDAMFRSLESHVADSLQGTGIAGAAATTVWSDHAAATPIDDVNTAMDAHKDACGMLPNQLVITETTWRHLKRCAQIIDRIKYSGLDDPKSVTLNAVAALLDLDEVVIAGAEENTAKTGQAATFGPIWDDSIAVLHKKAMTQDLQEPCSGRIFHWGGDGSAIGGVVEQYRDEAIRSDVLRVRHERVFKLLRAECARRITGVA